MASAVGDEGGGRLLLSTLAAVPTNSVEYIYFLKTIRIMLSEFALLNVFRTQMEPTGKESECPIDL